MQSRFITGLIFAKNPAVRTWAFHLLKNAGLSTEMKKAVIGKSIAVFMNYGKQTPENELLIQEAGNTLFELFGEELKPLNLPVIADLLHHEHSSILLFGLRLLKTQKIFCSVYYTILTLW